MLINRGPDLMPSLIVTYAGSLRADFRASDVVQTRDNTKTIIGNRESILFAFSILREKYL